MEAFNSDFASARKELKRKNDASLEDLPFDFLNREDGKLLQV